MKLIDPRARTSAFAGSMLGLVFYTWALFIHGIAYGAAVGTVFVKSLAISGAFVLPVMFFSVGTTVLAIAGLCIVIGACLGVLFWFIFLRSRRG